MIPIDSQRKPIHNNECLILLFFINTFYIVLNYLFLGKVVTFFYFLSFCATVPSTNTKTYSGPVPKLHLPGSGKQILINIRQNNSDPDPQTRKVKPLFYTYIKLSLCSNRLTKFFPKY